jgi:hypothetical protein
MQLYLLIIMICLGSNSVFASPFSIQGDTLIYNTEDGEYDGIALGHAEDLLEALQNNKDIKLIKLHSAGGVRIEAQYMADIIIDAGLDTHVNEECSSSCVRMFLAGKKRTADLGAQIGFHRGHWSADRMEKHYEKNKKTNDWNTPFDFASWIYDQAQIEVHELITYLTTRGVSTDIAAKIYRLGQDEMWFPRRNELLSSGILTE